MGSGHQADLDEGGIITQHDLCFDNKQRLLKLSLPFNNIQFFHFTRKADMK
jgi:hypothetical protein